MSQHSGTMHKVTENKGMIQSEPYVYYQMVRSVNCGEQTMWIKAVFS